MNNFNVYYNFTIDASPSEIPSEGVGTGTLVLSLLMELIFILVCGGCVHWLKRRCQQYNMRSPHCCACCPCLRVAGATLEVEPDMEQGLPALQQLKAVRKASRMGRHEVQEPMGCPCQGSVPRARPPLPPKASIEVASDDDYEEPEGQQVVYATVTPTPKRVVFQDPQEDNGSSPELHI